MTQWNAGTRIFSTVSSLEGIIVTGADVELAVAGTAVVAERPDAVENTADGADLAIGKRYEDADSGLVVMVTRAGAGPLTADGRDLAQRMAAALPSSD